ncbi:DMT family transporter [Altericroceibacterium endophyticum]|uniref:EamA family transporter n=1 Tax=Altericroceibacterium endophyticum TaxID=1808508 RepID=A0A6I4SZY5_9SPHN|nr:DMT family transporter [Altericroceibacterium endophyticum]MXO64267.1 EamA family transporter [Altericroceibacterium endophyticum]
MADAALIWVPFTLMAACAQVFRNAFQSRLAGRIGTLGGTQVRFIFGLPFAAVFLGVLCLTTGQTLPSLSGDAMLWALLGSAVQIAATFLMLVVMQKRDFGVAYAYIKTEPVSVAIMGWVLIGDHLPALSVVAICIVTVGVVLASLRKGDGAAQLAEWKPLAVGVASGALFGLSAISFRASIGALPEGGFVLRSLTMLVMTLGIQSAMLLSWFAFRDSAGLIGSLRQWRLSVPAGALGALASAGWFIAFSLTQAANVRTLALIEMPVVALVSRFVSGRWLSSRQLLGFAAIVAGVGLLMMAEAATG